jgi:hypothetical protein
MRAGKKIVEDMIMKKHGRYETALLVEEKISTSLVRVSGSSRISRGSNQNARWTISNRGSYFVQLHN